MSNNHSNKHVLWEPAEVLDRVIAEFSRGMEDLDLLEQDIRAELDGLSALALVDHGRVVA